MPVGATQFLILRKWLITGLTITSLFFFTHCTNTSTATVEHPQETGNSEATNDGNGSGGTSNTPEEGPTNQSAFTAIAPYDVMVGTQSVSVPLWGFSRTFDFGGSVPFVNATTGIADFDTINVWDSSAGNSTVVNSEEVTASGLPGRVFKTGGYTAIGYKSGDGIVEGALRTQLNSFSISSRRHYIWDLTVRFGGVDLNQAWTFFPRDAHPGTVWQIKIPGYPPALAMVVDTDPDDSQKLALHFDEHTNSNTNASRLGIATGLSPQQDISVTIDVYLDERHPDSGGQGYFKIAVNGNSVVDVHRQTMNPLATDPPYWTMGMYLYNDTTPLPYDLFSYWKIARMIAP